MTSAAGIPTAVFGPVSPSGRAMVSPSWGTVRFTRAPPQRFHPRFISRARDGFTQLGPSPFHPRAPAVVSPNSGPPAGARWLHPAGALSVSPARVRDSFTQLRPALVSPDSGPGSLHLYSGSLPCSFHQSGLTTKAPTSHLHFTFTVGWKLSPFLRARSQAPTVSLWFRGCSSCPKQVPSPPFHLDSWPHEPSVSPLQWARRSRLHLQDFPSRPDPKASVSPRQRARLQASSPLRTSFHPHLGLRKLRFHPHVDSRKLRVTP